MLRDGEHDDERSVCIFLGKCVPDKKWAGRGHDPAEVGGVWLEVCRGKMIGVYPAFFGRAA